MKDHYNDTPIDDFSEDRFGITPFAKALAKSLRNIKNPIGTAIGLHGAWGSGKSSTVNLIRKALKDEKDDALVVTEFNSWWYRGEEALSLAFLQHLNSTLNSTFGDKVKGLVPDLGRSILQAGPVIGPAVNLATGGLWGTLATGTISFSKRFFPDTTVEKNFNKLSQILKNEERRVLVIIDDIDRLSSRDALAIFRMIKSVGRLPNVLYLLVYDRELAEAAVEEHFPSEGPHFLEKIIQAGFELPAPTQDDLNTAVLTVVQEICGEVEGEDAVRRFMNLFYDIIAPRITTPRHVARLRNAISVTWPAIENEVNLADFLALEVIRLYEPTLFNRIRAARNNLFGSRDRDGSNGQEKLLDPFLKDVDADQAESVKLALMRLFPSMEGGTYSSEFNSVWDRERRVCVEKYFDTYFRLALSDSAMSASDTKELIQQIGDTEFLSAYLLKTARQHRKSGKSMIPLLMDELNAHAASIPKEALPSIIRTLFELHDQIDLPEDADRGFYGMANTSLRLHWFIRRATEPLDLDERSSIFLSSCQSASLGWIVDFATSALSDYDEDRERRADTVTLMTEDDAKKAAGLALAKIRSAVTDGLLLAHPDLIYILYRWRELSERGAEEVRAWTDQLMSDDEAVAVLAEGFTGTSWRMSGGVFGLGDRVSMPQNTVQLDDDSDIVDVVAFMAAVNRILEQKKLQPELLEKVRIFEDAYNSRKDSKRFD